MLGLENPIHLLFVLVVLLLVFGARRLPEMGKSLGSGLRGFKAPWDIDNGEGWRVWAVGYGRVAWVKSRGIYPSFHTSTQKTQDLCVVIYSLSVRDHAGTSVLQALSGHRQTPVPDLSIRLQHIACLAPSQKGPFHILNTPLYFAFMLWRAGSAGSPTITFA